MKKDGPKLDLEVYAFLTTTPNSLVATINHERMPVLLTREEEFATWLQGSCSHWPGNPPTDAHRSRGLQERGPAEHRRLSPSQKANNVEALAPRNTVMCLLHDSCYALQGSGWARAFRSPVPCRALAAPVSAATLGAAGHDFLSLSDTFAASASTTLNSSLRRDSTCRLAMIAAGERLF